MPSSCGNYSKNNRSCVLDAATGYYTKCLAYNTKYDFVVPKATFICVYYYYKGASNP
ncbi:hypothetical protein K432DRAFT_411896 [Lepidopterella palustris CBS 459.81]|uniref:Uncharacterized protein n=1 Tax=Lepidopterella palustris CBS 459.81 TaxID=1314670 RepID=A0A8E2DW00_9PEZI|nr:hypothetical protein K432DRAFT_411896 [Lepidopterella palustris CBS 459.81]